MMVQVEVTVKLSASAHLPPSKPGQKHWVGAREATRLIDANVVKYVGGGVVNPGAPEAGPLRRSAGWPIDRFSFVERKWDGETVAIIGGGPSVTPEVVAALKGRVRAIAINNSYLIAPWADVLYFADSDWWVWHTKGVKTAGLDPAEVARRFAAFEGQKVSIYGTGMLVADDRVHMMRVADQRKGLSKNPGALVTGGNSGYQSLNLAHLAGARRILLLGFDMSYPGGRSHWHGGHPTKHREDSYHAYARKFDTIRPDLDGVEVFNCSPVSKLTTFPRGDLESLLPRPG